jgi:preprotein translocase subunit SecD
MRPSRYLFTLAAIFIVLFGVVIGFGTGSVKDRLKPKLGLDLIGGTTLTLVAQTTNGQPPSADSLEQAREIIQRRVDAFGVSEAQVVTEGQNHIVISVPGENNNTLRQVGVPAQLRFRKVIKTAQDSPAAAEPSPSATPSPGATPSAGASGSAAPSSSASAAATASATAQPTPTTAPSATAAPSGSAAAAPSGSAAGAAPSGSAAPDLKAQQEAVIKKLGPAVTVASQIKDPATAAADPAMMKQLEPFRQLTPADVAILPVQIQFNVPQVTCKALNERPPGSIQDKNQQAVACEKGSNTKLLLDKAKVEGTDLSSAAANIDTTAGAAWKVDLTFSNEGSTKWAALTKEAYNNDQGACAATVPNKNGSGQPVCQVAVVLDNEVVTAPGIQGVLSTQSEISGGFDKTSATLLANQLKYGALPITFKPGDLNSVSATLGADYLRAGLLAAGVGMVLVIAYAFFYYRLLGSVIFGSLVLSALLTYGMLVLLGRQIGFTVTLAGIAGFIVSLGVAADSFVIYFERLKDEIREGRSPRSAIPRAWVRARRTIITANAVTILAAVVLYIVGVGSVKGFAFALGLATSLDLLIVFLFRHPIMTMLARTPAFLSPRVSGLGRVLRHAREDAPAPGKTRAKEA